MSTVADAATTSTVSASDILTALKNVVTALNNQTLNDTILAGQQNFSNLTAATVVKSTAGRIVRVSVLVAGSAVGKVYDANSATDTSRPLYTIPMTVGTVLVDIPTAYGVVVVPGTGQTVSGSFS